MSGCFRIVIGCGESASDRWCDLEDRQQPMRSEQGLDFFRLGDSRDTRGSVGPDAHILKDPILAAVGEIQRWRNVEVVDVDARGGVPERDELFGVGIGQRLEQDAVDHAEHRRVRADADSERQQRQDREHRRLRESSQRVHTSPRIADDTAPPGKSLVAADTHGRLLDRGRRVTSRSNPAIATLTTRRGSSPCIRCVMPAPTITSISTNRSSRANTRHDQ